MPSSFERLANFHFERIKLHKDLGVAALALFSALLVANVSYFQTQSLHPIAHVLWLGSVGLLSVAITFVLLGAALVLNAGRPSAVALLDLQRHLLFAQGGVLTATESSLLLDEFKRILPGYVHAAVSSLGTTVPYATQVLMKDNADAFISKNDPWSLPSQLVDIENATISGTILGRSRLCPEQASLFRIQFFTKALEAYTKSLKVICTTLHPHLSCYPPSYHSAQCPNRIMHEFLGSISGVSSLEPAQRSYVWGGWFFASALVAFVVTLIVQFFTNDRIDESKIISTALDVSQIASEPGWKLVRSGEQNGNWIVIFENSSGEQRITSVDPSSYSATLIYPKP
jgi:hypothetical protein